MYPPDRKSVSHVSSVPLCKCTMLHLLPITVMNILSIVIVFTSVMAIVSAQIDPFSSIPSSVPSDSTVASRFVDGDDTAAVSILFNHLQLLYAHVNISRVNH